jgi:hypothetical protein
MSIQRTAMGKAVDMAALTTRNEKTRAVGNMSVNARGDILDSNNQVINDNTKRVKASYAKTVTPQSNGVNTGLTFGDEIVPDELTAAEQEFEQDDEDIQK